MPYLPSGYNTPTRSSSVIHQARSHHAHRRRIELLKACDSNALLPKNNSWSSSLRLHPKTSSNLLSLVSKFEALDFLSGTQKSPPRPSTLGRSNKLVKQAVPGDSPRHRKLSTITSSISRNRSGDKNSCSLNELALGIDGVAISPEHITARTKKSGSGKLRQDISSQKPISLRLRQGNQNDKSNSVKAANTLLEREKYFTKEGPKTSVKDRIKFFDKSTENCRSHYQDSSPTCQLLSNAHLTAPYTTTSRVQSRLRLETLASQGQVVNKASPSTTSIFRRTTPKALSAKSVAHGTPQKSPHSVLSSETLVFKDFLPNAFLVSIQSKTSIQSISPRISPRTCINPTKLADIPHDLLSSRIKTTQSNSVTKGTTTIPGWAKQEALRGIDRDRGRCSTAVGIKLMNAKQRKFSNKIEALYNAKSVEMYAASRGASKERGLSNVRARREVFEPVVQRPPKEGEAQRQDSRGANIKTFFDGQRDTNAVDERNYSLLKPPIALSPRKPTFCQSWDARALTPLLPPPGRALRQSTIPIIWPVPAAKLKDWEAEALEDITAAGAQNHLPRSAVERPQIQKNAGSGDKIKLLEEKLVGPKTTVSQATRDSIQLRKAERPHDPDDIATKERRGLSAKEVNDIVREFQDIEDELMVGESRLLGRWNEALTVTSAAGLDGSMSRTGEMIVKEVKCGLKQPKPVRLIELKRIMWLCREKPGVHADKRAGSGLATKKF